MARGQSRHGQHPSATPLKAPLVLNLSDKITRPGDGYCETGASADVYKCQYKSDEGLKAVRAIFPSW